MPKVFSGVLESMLSNYLSRGYTSQRTRRRRGRSYDTVKQVLGWETVFESVDDIRDTMEALTTEIDIGVMFEGLDPGHKHSLVSMVCYHGQHYVCFAYNRQHRKWILYDDETMKDIGSWKDVTSECERERLQPQVLFFETQKVLVRGTFRHLDSLLIELCFRHLDQ